MSEAIDVQSYKSHQAREAAFEQWWHLTSHITMPEQRKALAREAYFAAWGGGNAAAQDVADKGLLDALKFGEAACLVACALEPISANHQGWKDAAERIKKERQRLGGGR